MSNQQDLIKILSDLYLNSIDPAILNDNPYIQRQAEQVALELIKDPDIRRLAEQIAQQLTNQDTYNQLLEKQVSQQLIYESPDVQQLAEQVAQLFIDQNLDIQRLAEQVATENKSNPYIVTYMRNVGMVFEGGIIQNPVINFFNN